MSNREKCIAILDNFNDKQLANIAAMLQAALDAIVEASEDASDNAFCAKLYEDYQADPDKDQTVSIEQAAQMLGVTL